VRQLKLRPVGGAAATLRGCRRSVVLARLGAKPSVTPAYLI